MNAGVLAPGYAPPVMPRPLLGGPQPVPMPYGRGGDPFWNSVSLLLRMNGSHNATTFVDESRFSRTLTNVGANLSGAQSRFGGTSGFFAATSYLTQSADLTLASDFTLEFWFYLAVFPAYSFPVFFIIGNEATGRLQFLCNQQRQLCLDRFGPGLVAFTGGAFPLSEWCHIAYTRAGSTVRAFVNGVQTGTTTISGTLGLSAAYRVGNNNGGANGAGGWISELRLTRGVARYTSPFPPPTAPFPIGYQ